MAPALNDQEAGSWKWKPDRSCVCLIRVIELASRSLSAEIISLNLLGACFNIFMLTYDNLALRFFN